MSFQQKRPGKEVKSNLRLKWQVESHFEEFVALSFHYEVSIQLSQLRNYLFAKPTRIIDLQIIGGILLRHTV